MSNKIYRTAGVLIIIAAVYILLQEFVPGWSLLSPKHVSPTDAAQQPPEEDPPPARTERACCPYPGTKAAQPDSVAENVIDIGIKLIDPQADENRESRILLPDGDYNGDDN